MSLKRLALLLPLLAAACGASQQPAKITPGTQQAAIAVNDTAARNCPWPADLARYEQTTLTARHKYGALPDLGVFRDIKQGCAILTFTVGDLGIVTGSQIMAENPPGFGAIATKMLRWNDYAEGGSPLTVFMVRIGGAGTPDGGAMTSLGFKDATINLFVPP